MYFVRKNRALIETILVVTIFILIKVIYNYHKNEAEVEEKINQLDLIDRQLKHLYIEEIINAKKRLNTQEIQTDSKSYEIATNIAHKKVQLLCLIFTSAKNLKLNKTRVISQTWATKCDKYFFVARISNKTLTTPIIHNHTLPIFEPKYQTNIKYKKFTDRLYHTYMDIFKLFPDYDFYFKCNDDTFVFIDNMRNFLTTKNPNDPVTFGFDFKVNVDYGYPSGGAGFILTREAVRRLTSKLNTNYTSCENTGVDDVDVSKCLRSVHVYMSNTLDEVGRERFHPLNMESYVKGQFPNWLYKYSANPVKKGIECCSNSSISFHYTKPEQMQIMYNMWEKGKQDGLTADENIQNIMKVIAKVEKLE